MAFGDQYFFIEVGQIRFTFFFCTMGLDVIFHVLVSQAVISLFVGIAVNLPLDDNDYVIVDAGIPLYEMIVPGSIDYCGNVYNLTDVSDERQQILTMIEYGASPHFLFTWEETTLMKYSGMNSSYATTFSTWLDRAARVYGEVNAVLSRVSGAVMESHEILDSGIRKILYSNGVTIYVNYTDWAVSADGVQIPAMGYVVR